MTWTWQTFDELSPASLYDIMRLRQEVFVLGQNCVYVDADGKDPSCLHLMGHGKLSNQSNDGLVAYLRVVPAGLKFTELSIGRVAVDQALRGKGLGNDLMKEALRGIEERFGLCPIRISAQLYLQRFYSNLGFEVMGTPYDEVGIPHIQMLR